jgi:hypothetical protein
LKAGHPELVFELDSQSVNEPKHWRDDDQWVGPRGKELNLLREDVRLRDNFNPKTFAEHLRAFRVKL